MEPLGFLEIIGKMVVPLIVKLVYVGIHWVYCFFKGLQQGGGVAKQQGAHHPKGFPTIFPIDSRNVLSTRLFKVVVFLHGGGWRRGFAAATKTGKRFVLEVSKVSITHHSCKTCLGFTQKYFKDVPLHGWFGYRRFLGYIYILLYLVEVFIIIH